MKARRFRQNPIILPHMDNRIGSNINGPSLIRVPPWVQQPLGRYYLYFAHHQGTYIRLAYADDLAGPWHIHARGVLDLADSYFDTHIASPDVHIIEASQEIRMYYHGCCLPVAPHQGTRIASSKDGLSFQARPELLGPPYFRAFQWKHYWYTLEMPGVFRRSPDGLTAFEQGPRLPTKNMRHAAVYRAGSTLYVFYTNKRDCPESILWTSIDLQKDWQDWRILPPRVLLRPRCQWEGGDCPLAPSRPGAAPCRVRQLRDPCVFFEGGKLYLLYCVAGESGIAIAELVPSSIRLPDSCLGLANWTRAAIRHFRTEGRARTPQ